jgi:mannose-1-phosphate guanylyltransferase/phosphomannomutase
MEPGGEKIALIDERGAWYSGMRLLTIVLKLFMETNRHREPYKIGISIVATSEIEEIAKDYNVEIFRIKNSHSAMMEATREDNVLFVGGIYGGYIFSDFLFASDGMYTVGKILEMLSKTEYRISQLDKELPRRFHHMVSVPCPWEMKGRVMRRAMAESEGAERLLVEGVKIFTDSGSVLMLPTKEKESFSVFGESEQYETAQSLAKKYGNKISQWQEEA